MSYFSTLFNQQQSFRLSQLQSKIFSNKTNLRNSCSPPQTINQPQDLKIISPFYKRIDQHPQNCKCMYHKRIRFEVKKIQKFKTQPAQIGQKHKENEQKQQIFSILPTIQSIIKDQQLQSQEFDSWKKKLSAETLKNYYYDYLKSIANFSKFKRHQKLDCYNHAFEQFLRNNYLVILDRKKTQNEIRNQTHKYSHKNLIKVKTEGNIDTIELTKKALQSSKDNLTPFSQAFINKYPSSKDGLKVKKIAFKSTGKQIQLSSEQMQSTEKKQKKIFKKVYSSRPSFFGLIQDQQIIRQICSRFIHQNKSENKQAELMMKQLVDSDIEMYTKLMKDIQQNLQGGLTFPNLDQQQALMLVKIVLHKLNKEIQAKKNKDSNYAAKNVLIQNLCGKYGWSKDEKPINLHQFWKMTQSIKNVIISRNSIGTQKETKYRDQRSKSPYLSSPKNEKNNNSRVSRVSRMSGFSKDRLGKYFTNALNSQTGSNMSNKYLLESEIAQQKQDTKLYSDEFKMKTSRSGTVKKGVLTKKKKKKLSGLYEIDQVKKMYGLVRKQTCFFQSYQGQRQIIGSDLAIKDQNQDKIKIQIKEHDDRNSSIYSNSKNMVLRHIETNKKFLKRIQNQLMGNDCNNLIIGIGTNVLTKKRKIRAIYNALQCDSLEYIQSTKYSNLLKYLEIYEEYCDLIVKMKKDKNIKSEASMGKLSEPNLQEKEGEAEEINNLIADLSKERQLKYFYLKWLQEKDDPKQQLILKIPQNTNVRQGRAQNKKKTKPPIQQVKPQSHDQAIPKQESFIQKGLESHVNVYCQMGKPFTNQKSIQKQDSLPTNQKLTDFQLKIINYRKMLKLQEKECMH